MWHEVSFVGESSRDLCAHAIDLWPLTINKWHSNRVWMALDPWPNAGSGTSSHPDWHVQSVHRAPLLNSNGSIRLGTSKNSVWPAPRHLSWYFDIFVILVSLSKHLPLISILDSSSKWDWEWLLVHLLEWLHLVALEDCCVCGFLVTLGGCRHLDGLKQWWKSDICWWLFVAVTLGFKELNQVSHMCAQEVHTYVRMKKYQKQCYYITYT
jgi:hypothetical protein